MHSTAASEETQSKTSSVLAGSECSYCDLVMHVSAEQSHSLVVINVGAAKVDFLYGRDKCSETFLKKDLKK